MHMGEEVEVLQSDVGRLVAFVVIFTIFVGKGACEEGTVYSL